MEISIPPRRGKQPAGDTFPAGAAGLQPGQRAPGRQRRVTAIGGAQCPRGEGGRSGRGPAGTAPLPRTRRAAGSPAPLPGRCRAAQRRLPLPDPSAAPRAVRGGAAHRPQGRGAAGRPAGAPLEGGDTGHLPMPHPTFPDGHGDRPRPCPPNTLPPRPLRPGVRAPRTPRGERAAQQQRQQQRRGQPAGGAAPGGAHGAGQAARSLRG